MHGFRIAVFAAAASLALEAGAGVYIETQESMEPKTEQAPVHRMYIQDGAARFEHTHRDNPAKFVIFRDDQLYVVEPSRKRYTVLDHESARAIGGAVDSAKDQMRKELAKLKPEQRAMVDQMMGDKAASMLAESSPKAVIVARETGQADEINGVACRNFEITRDGLRSEELCVAPFSSVPGKEDFLDLARRMQSLLQDLTEALAQAGGSVEDLALMDRVQGFPVRIRRYDDSQALQNEVVLKTWREEAFPAATFEVPADYTRRDLKSELARK